MKSSQPALAVRGVRSVVAGFGPDGREFGELVPTADLLAQMRPLHPGSGEPRPAEWVAGHLGIRSVAVAADTLRVCRRIWDARPAHTAESACVVSLSDYNFTLYAMLGRAVGRVVGDLTAARPAARVAAHVHVCAGSHQFIEPELNAVRRATGLADRTLTTLILQQGCAGLLHALDLADALLAAAPGPDAHVLITAEHNMLFTSHLRARHTEWTNRDVNYWLWPAIFGEGVGALVVGRPDGGSAEWRVAALGYEATDCATPVAGPVLDRDRLGFKMLIQARQVRQNYLAGVSKHAAAAVDRLGGPDRLHRLCLHESNPLLVREVAARLGVPAGRVPTFSAEVGTLACVSAFMLLEAALAAEPDGGRTGVACGLIGEAGGHLLSGYLCLDRTPAPH